MQHGDMLHNEKVFMTLITSQKLGIRRQYTVDSGFRQLPS